MVGCTGSEPVDSAASEVGAGRRLTMDQDWETVALPDGSSIDSYAVGRPMGELRTARIWVASRQQLGFEPAPDGIVRNDVTVWRSEDGGRSFEKRTVVRGVPARATIQVAPSDDSIVYLAAGGLSSGMTTLDAPGQLWVSTDGGDSFQRNNAPGPGGLPETPVKLDINPENPRHLVGATCRGVFRSLDGGMNFDRIPNSPDLGTGCTSATLHRAEVDRDVMYVTYAIGETMGGTVYRTLNGAGTWEELTSFGSYTMGFEIHPKNARRLYTFDFFRGWISSEDAGTTWNPHNRTLELGGGAHDDPPFFSSARLSNVAFDTFTGAEPTLYIVNSGLVKRWMPDASRPENGEFWDALLPPLDDLDAVRFANLGHDATGAPEPILVGIAPARGVSNQRTLRLARLRITH